MNSLFSYAIAALVLLPWALVGFGVMELVGLIAQDMRLGMPWAIAWVVIGGVGIIAEVLLLWWRRNSI